MNNVLDRWNEHYTEMLNHPPATTSPDLDAAAQQATPMQISLKMHQL